MKIIGCDFHTRQQQIEMLDTNTAEVVELCGWSTPTAKRGDFTSSWASRSIVGIEATGYTLWFEKMLAELGHELWVGDAPRFVLRMVRKQKNDVGTRAHLRKLLEEERFPRIWMPTPAERDLRQLVLHRVKLVQMRTKVMNQLHALAMGQGLCRKKKLWSKVGRAGTGGAASGSMGFAAAEGTAGTARSFGEADCGVAAGGHPAGGSSSFRRPG